MTDEPLAATNLSPPVFIQSGAIECATTWRERVRASQEPLDLIKKFVPAGGLTVISGPAKRGCKTWTSLVLGQVIASGQAIGCLEPGVPASPILLCEFEGAAKPFENRLTMLEKGWGHEFANVNTYIMHRKECYLDEPAHVRHLIDAIKWLGIRFVLIDTLTEVHRGNENDMRDMGTVARGWMTILRECPGIGVAVIHHLRKPLSERTDDIDDELRGSSSLAGKYDSHIACRRYDSSQPYVDVTVRRREGGEHHYQFRWDINEQSSVARLDILEKERDEVSSYELERAIYKLVPGEWYSDSSLKEAWTVQDAGRVKRMKHLLLEAKQLERKVTDTKYVRVAGGAHEA